MSKIDRLRPANADQIPSPAAKAPDAAPVQDAAAPAKDEAPPKKGGRKRAILGAVALIALLGGGYEGYHYWTVGRFMVETDDAYVHGDIAQISSRVQGYVAELPVQENDRVKAGEVLVRLDDRDYRIALETAQSQYETASDTLNRINAQIDAARAGVKQAEASRDAAVARQTNAQTTADRITALTQRSVAAQAQLDDAKAALDTAKANVASAEAAIASAEAQVSVLQAQYKEAEGSRHELELAVKQAQVNLDRTVLTAPFDGVIGNLGIKLGDLVSPGVALASLVPQSGLYVEANFKETQLDGIRPGATVDVEFDAMPGQDFQGTVVSTAPATGSVFSLLPPDNATGNFTKVVQRVPVRIELTGKDAGTPLQAGLSAIVTVDSRTGGPAGTVQTASE